MSGAIHTWRELSSTPSRHVRKRLSDRASHNPIVALPHPLISSAMGCLVPHLPCTGRWRRCAMNE